MKKVEVWQADNGSLEKDPQRAKAHDLWAALPEGVNPNSKVLDFGDCLTIMKHADLVAKHVKEFRDFVFFGEADEDKGE